MQHTDAQYMHTLCFKIPPVLYLRGTQSTIPSSVKDLITRRCLNAIIIIMMMMVMTAVWRHDSFLVHTQHTVIANLLVVQLSVALEFYIYLHIK
jgi:hypothetical protein